MENELKELARFVAREAIDIVIRHMPNVSVDDSATIAFVASGIARQYGFGDAVVKNVYDRLGIAVPN